MQQIGQSNVAWDAVDWKQNFSFNLIFIVNFKNCFSLKFSDYFNDSNVRISRAVKQTNIYQTNWIRNRKPRNELLWTIPTPQRNTHNTGEKFTWTNSSSVNWIIITGNGQQSKYRKLNSSAISHMLMSNAAREEKPITSAKKAINLSNIQTVCQSYLR